MEPGLVLDPLEARLLGVLVEKELTTPDQYPLSLNALLAGASQKSNRDPLMEPTEAETRLCLDGLRAKHLAGAVAPASGRAVYRFKQTAGVHLALPVPLLATLAELLLRGPQALGELRARVQRMCPVESLDVLRGWLETLRARGLAEELAPSPGSRAPRWRQTLAPSSHPEPSAQRPAPQAASGEPLAPAGARTSPAPSPGPVGEARFAALEAEVARLRRRLEGLAESLGETLGD